MLGSASTDLCCALCLNLFGLVVSEHIDSVFGNAVRDEGLPQLKSSEIRLSIGVSHV